MLIEYLCTYFIIPTYFIIVLCIFRNKEKEESRQGKLAEFKQTGIWPGLKSKPAEKIAWSKKVEQKQRKEDRKRKKEMKQASNSKIDDFEDDDDDDLDEDYRLLKKMRKVSTKKVFYLYPTLQYYQHSNRISPLIFGNT